VWQVGSRLTGRLDPDVLRNSAELNTFPLNDEVDAMPGEVFHTPRVVFRGESGMARFGAGRAPSALKPSSVVTSEQGEAADQLCRLQLSGWCLGISRTPRSACPSRRAARRT
jgi:hypothetical protein